MNKSGKNYWPASDNCGKIICCLSCGIEKEMFWKYFGYAHKKYYFICEDCKETFQRSYVKNNIADTLSQEWGKIFDLEDEESWKVDIELSVWK